MSSGMINSTAPFHHINLVHLLLAECAPQDIKNKIN